MRKFFGLGHAGINSQVSRPYPIRQALWGGNSGMQDLPAKIPRHHFCGWVDRRSWKGLGRVGRARNAREGQGRNCRLKSDEHENRVRWKRDRAFCECAFTTFLIVSPSALFLCLGCIVFLAQFKGESSNSVVSSFP
jgi:hypothetical protein